MYYVCFSRLCICCLYDIALYYCKKCNIYSWTGTADEARKPQNHYYKIKTSKIIRTAHKIKVKGLTCSLYQHTFPCALD